MKDETRLVNYCFSQEAPCVLDNFSVLEEEDRSEAEAGTAPVRPPRRARKKLKPLSLDGDTSLHEDSHQNDILFRTDSSVKLNRDNQCLKGIASQPRCSNPIGLFVREYFGSNSNNSGVEVPVETAVGLL